MEPTDSSTSEGKKLSNSNQSKALSLTPAMTALFEPTATYLGRELRDLVKGKIEHLKGKKRKKNIQKHMEVVDVTLGEPPSYDEKGVESIKQPDLFDEWVDGAQDVDPEDEVLAKLWQGLLLEIAKGKSKNRLLIKTLKQLEPNEAEWLLMLKKNTRVFRIGTLLRDSECKFIVKKLKSLGLVEFEWRFLAMLGLCMVSGILFLLFRILEPSLASAPLASDIKGVYRILGLMLLSSIFVFYFMVLFCWYKPSWLGEKLLKVASSIKK